MHRELDEEVQFHIESETEENVRRGLSPTVAREEALRRFGRIGSIKDACRMSWGTLAFENFVGDIRMAFRLMAKDRQSTAVAVLALSIGVAFSITIFGLLSNYLLNGLAFDQSERLVYLETVSLTDPNRSRDIYFEDFVQIKGQQTSFENLVALEERTVGYQTGKYATRVFSYSTTGDLLGTLRVAPLLGRNFSEADSGPGGNPVVILSHSQWQSEHGGSPEAIGSQVIVDGAVRSIIGVLPPDFRFLKYANILVPQQREIEGVDTVVVIGRMATGISRESAETELNGLIARLERAESDGNPHSYHVRVRPLHHASLGDATIRQVWILQVFAVLVLLVGCANVANLLLAKYLLRRKELALRCILGATRLRIITQIMTETMAIAILSGVSGLVLAHIGTHMLWDIVKSLAPYWVTPFRLETSHIVFALAAAIASCLAAGILPALRASKINLHRSLSDDERTSSSLKVGQVSRFLITVQVALSFALLTASGLMFRAMSHLKSIDLPYNPAEIHTARVVLRDAHYFEGDRFLHFYRRLAERFASEPGVTEVGITSRATLAEGRRASVVVDGASDPQAEGPTEVRFEMVSTGYFESMGAWILRGRDFKQTDTSESLQVAVVNPAFVSAFWPGTDPIGKRFRVVGDESSWITVVGIAPDLRIQGLFNFDESGIGFYRPMAQQIDNTMSIVVPIRDANLNWEETVRRLVASLDPTQAPKEIGTFQQAIDAHFASPAVVAGLFASFGVAAVLLAGIGIYGILSFSVNERRREFGIRLALGGLPSQILTMVVRQSILPLSLGLAPGIILAFGFGTWLERARLIEEVSPGDPLTYSIVFLLVGAIAIASVYIPARRASNVPPSGTLFHG